MASRTKNAAAVTITLNHPLYKYVVGDGPVAVKYYNPENLDIPTTYILCMHLFQDICMHFSRGFQTLTKILSTRSDNFKPNFKSDLSSYWDYLCKGSIRFLKLWVPLLQGRILQWKFECILCIKVSKSGGAQAMAPLAPWLT